MHQARLASGIHLVFSNSIDTRRIGDRNVSIKDHAQQERIYASMSPFGVDQAESPETPFQAGPEVEVLCSCSQTDALLG